MCFRIVPCNFQWPFFGHYFFSFALMTLQTTSPLRWLGWWLCREVHTKEDQSTLQNDLTNQAVAISDVKDGLGLWLGLGLGFCSFSSTKLFKTSIPYPVGKWSCQDIWNLRVSWVIVERITWFWNIPWQDLGIVSTIHAGSVQDLGMILTRSCLNILARLYFKSFFLEDMKYILA